MPNPYDPSTWRTPAGPPNHYDPSTWWQRAATPDKAYPTWKKVLARLGLAWAALGSAYVAIRGVFDDHGLVYIGIATLFAVAFGHRLFTWKLKAKHAPPNVAVMTPLGPPSKPHAGKRRLALALLGLLLVGLGAGVGALYENARWTPLYAKATSDLAQARKGASDYQQLAAENQDALNTLNRKVADTVGDLDHPSFVLWNSCGAAGPNAGCSLRPGYEYIGGVPDTFTYYVGFRSTVPVSVYIMSSSNFVCWETHYCAWHGVGWENKTSLDGVFHDAEGCAGYIAVFVSNQSGTLYPNVRVTRNPATNATGACA